MKKGEEKILNIRGKGEKKREKSSLVIPKFKMGGGAAPSSRGEKALAALHSVRMFALA